jgi:hypothetical protein
LGSLTVYRPYFIAFAIASLAWAFFRHFGGRVREARGGGAMAVLAALRPAKERDALLCLGSLIVAAMMIVPPWSVTRIFQGPKPRVIVDPWAKERSKGVSRSPVVLANPCAAKNPCATKNPCSAR